MTAPRPAAPDLSATARQAAQPGELAALLKRLHLANVRRTYPEFIDRAEREDWSFHGFPLALARGSRHIAPKLASSAACDGFDSRRGRIISRQPGPASDSDR